MYTHGLLSLVSCVCVNIGGRHMYTHGLLSLVSCVRMCEYRREAHVHAWPAVSS